MAYVKIIFQNSPSTATPINAENLNHMDDQIALNDQRLTELEGAHVSSFNGRTGAVTPADGDYDIGQIAPLTGAQVGQVPVVTNIGTEEAPELVFRMGAGGGAGGHEIIDSEGNTMPQESAMQFPDSHVSDDSTNGRTIVENIKEHTTASDYEQATEDGFHVIDDGNDVPIGEIEEDYVEVEGDGNTTYADLFALLHSKIDADKITNNAKLVRIVGDSKLIHTIGANYFKQTSPNNYGDFFVVNAIGGRTEDIDVIRLASSSANCSYYTLNGGTSAGTNHLSNKPASGVIWRVYYGTSSTVINLKTSANYCMMSDGETSVESTLTKNNLENYIDIKSYDSTSNPYTFPEDGYLFVGARDNGDNCFCKVYGNDMRYATEMRARSYLSLSWDISTLFVKKGMKFVYDSGSGTTIARYMKLV